MECRAWFVKYCVLYMILSASILIESSVTRGSGETLGWERKDPICKRFLLSQLLPGES